MKEKLSNNNMKEKLAYNPKDLSMVLSISIDKAYELIHTKGFPSTKIGGRYIIGVKQLEEWLENYAGKEFDLEDVR